MISLVSWVGVLFWASSADPGSIVCQLTGWLMTARSRMTSLKCYLLAAVSNLCWAQLGCLISSPCASQVCFQGGLWVLRTARGQPQYVSILQSSASVTPVNIPLTKASHRAKPRRNGETKLGKQTSPLYGKGQFVTIFAVRHNLP